MLLMETPLPAIPKDLLFVISKSFADIVVFDSDPGDNTLILTSCPELLDGLARAPMWLADGTFKVVPSVFFQLYTIHFAFGNGVCPAVIGCIVLYAIIRPRLRDARLSVRTINCPAINCPRLTPAIIWPDTRTVCQNLSSLLVQ